jgi:hypothetical protein
MVPDCPNCRRPIPAANINIKEGVALCPGCGSLTRLADLAQDPRLAGVDMADPPAGCTLTSDGVETVVTASGRSIGTALAALGIALFWNGIVSVFVLVVLASTIQHIFGSVPAWFPAPPMTGQGGLGQGMPVGMTVFMWLFLTPFMLIGAAFCAAVVMSIAGRVEVRLRDAEGVLFVGCGPIGMRRRFDSTAVRSVSIGQTRWTQNDQTKPLIVIETDRELRFGSMLPEARRAWLAVALRKLLLPSVG